MTCVLLGAAHGGIEPQRERAASREVPPASFSSEPVGLRQPIGPPPGSVPGGSNLFNQRLVKVGPIRATYME